MNVVVTRRAEADLERIGDAIATDSPRRAASFVAEIKEKCESLAAMPKLFLRSLAIAASPFAAASMAIT